MITMTLDQATAVCEELARLVAEARPTIALAQDKLGGVVRCYGLDAAGGSIREAK